jgi:hypothetical protein
MAITLGAGAHFAWLETNGGTFPIEHGTADQHAQRKTSEFSVELPLNYPGAYDALQSATTGSVIVSSLAGSGTLVSGNLKEIDFDLIGTKIRVTGHDEGSALHDVKSSENFTNQTGSQIVSTIAGRLGLGVVTNVSDSLMAGKMLKQDYARITDGVSYAGLIHKLAELDGARWWVNQGTLYYVASNTPEGSYSINYNPGPPIQSDCLQLRIIRNVPADQTINVTVKSWHPLQKQVFTGTGTAGSGNGTLNYIYHAPNLLQDHVQQYAQAKANEHARHAITIEAEVVGDPAINVAMGLNVNGTGGFDGQYEIDEIRHTFGMEGYTMIIVAKGTNGGGAGGEAN